jgi:hypothetical protein
LAARRTRRFRSAALVASLLLAVGACGDGKSARAAPATRVLTPISAASLEILGDIERWDAATAAARREAAMDVGACVPHLRPLRAEMFETDISPREVWIYADEVTGLEFVLVPGGVLPVIDGSVDTRIPIQPFLVSRTECTQEAYERVTGTNPSNWRGPRLPVESVRWHDAVEFCERAAMALPSEAEWAWASRGCDRLYDSCYGDDREILGEYAWFARNSGVREIREDEEYDQTKIFGEWDCRTHEVGLKRANPLGLFDVHGNVYEWCAGDARDLLQPWLPAPWDRPADIRLAHGGCIASWSPSDLRVRDALLDATNVPHKSNGFRPVIRIRT